MTNHQFVCASKVSIDCKCLFLTKLEYFFRSEHASYASVLEQSCLIYWLSLTFTFRYSIFWNIKHLDTVLSDYGKSIPWIFLQHRPNIRWIYSEHKMNTCWKWSKMVRDPRLNKIKWCYDKYGRKIIKRSLEHLSYIVRTSVEYPLNIKWTQNEHMLNIEQNGTRP